MTSLKSSHLGKKPLSTQRGRFRGLILSEFHSWNKLIFSVPIRGLVLWCFNDISAWINVLHRFALTFTNIERVPNWLSDSLSSIDFTAAIFRWWGNCILSAYWKSLVKAVNAHGLLQLPHFSLVAVLFFFVCVVFRSIESEFCEVRWRSWHCSVSTDITRLPLLFPVLGKDSLQWGADKLRPSVVFTMWCREREYELGSGENLHAKLSVGLIMWRWHTTCMKYLCW